MDLTKHLAKYKGLWVPLTLAAVILIVDQISKNIVAAQLKIGQSWDIAPWLAPIFSITHVTNTGVAFGMLQGLGNVFVFAHIIAAAAIIVYAYRLPPEQWFLRLTLGLALGGALGNLVDRLRLGYVVDFIDANLWPFTDFPVFNVADASISVGVTLMVGLMLWEERQERLRQQVAEGG